MNSSKKLFIMFCVLVSFLFYGCPKKVSPPQVEPPKEAIEEPMVDEEPPIRDEEFYSIPELKPIYFEFDQYHLTEEAKDILQKNAEFLLANPQYEILIEGHCCECGSNEYNLALGQKRASTIREYYISLGISADRIATISYGEEKPINKNAGPPDSPLCKPNRRGETKVRVKK